MAWRVRASVWAALIFVAGCGGFEDDMKMICEVKTRSAKQLGDTSKIDRSVFVTMYAAYIDDNASSDEAKQLIAKVGSKQADHAEKQRLVAEAMKKVGITRCEFLDALKESEALQRRRNVAQ